MATAVLVIDVVVVPALLWTSMLSGTFADMTGSFGQFTRTCWRAGRNNRGDLTRVLTALIRLRERIGMKERLLRREIRNVLIHGGS